MGISHKAAYRFGYLRSEKWKTVRIASLARAGARCRLCGIRSLNNDVHHWRYPESVWDTKPFDTLVLCRDCHNLIHAIIDSDKMMARKRIEHLVGRINVWIESMQQRPKDEIPIKPKQLTPPEICCCCRQNALPLSAYDIFTGHNHRPQVFMFCPACLETMKRELMTLRQLGNCGIWKMFRFVQKSIQRQLDRKQEPVIQCLQA